MEENREQFLLDGYKEIIALIDDNIDEFHGDLSEASGSLYSPHELLEKIIEVSEIRTLGELCR